MPPKGKGRREQAPARRMSDLGIRAFMTPTQPKASTGGGAHGTRMLAAATGVQNINPQRPPPAR